MTSISSVCYVQWRLYVTKWTIEVLTQPVFGNSGQLVIMDGF